MYKVNERDRERMEKKVDDVVAIVATIEQNFLFRISNGTEEPERKIKILKKERDEDAVDNEKTFVLRSNGANDTRFWLFKHIIAFNSILFHSVRRREEGLYELQQQQRQHHRHLQRYSDLGVHKCVLERSLHRNRNCMYGNVGCWCA